MHAGPLPQASIYHDHDWSVHKYASNNNDAAAMLMLLLST